MFAVTAEMDSMLKKLLKSLCQSYGWSYGVFWRFDQPNSMLLTMEDAYYEEQMSFLINNLLLQVHILGQGIIGQAAFTGKHRWMFSDACHLGNNAIASVGSQDMFQDDLDFHCQFSSGIKTIVVIPIGAHGVVQFGSTLKMPENLEFMDQTKRLFNEIEHCKTTELAYSLTSFRESFLHQGNLKSGHVDNVNGLIRTACASMSSTEPSFLTSLCGGNINNQMPLWPSSNIGKAAADTPCTSTFNSEGSTMTSLGQPVLMRGPGSSDVSGRQNTGMSSKNEFQNFQGDLAECHCTFLGEVMPPNPNLPDKSCPGKDASQLLASPPDPFLNGLIAPHNDDLPQIAGVTPTFPGLDGMEVFRDKTLSYPADSVQSSITHVFSSEVKDVQLSVPIQIPHEDDLFEGLGLDFSRGQGQGGSFWEDVIMQNAGGDLLGINMGSTECISELVDGSSASTHKGLFSELGIDQLLKDVFGSEHQLPSSKRAKTESPLVNGLATSVCSSSNPVGCLYNLKKASNYGSMKDVPKSQVGLWIDDSNSTKAGFVTAVQPRKSEEPAKVIRKRARPGESSRPRPKDRQMIQDRVKELREIIPNGAKCSIDALLDRTIKHMLFLQGVTKHADKLKQFDDPKLMGQEFGRAPKENISNCGGTTWAFEVDDHAMFCPVIVQDLNPPGHMLIEMVCEERGLFLEIADTIRGFGLTILKGVMEVQEDRIWARFIVEANTHVTRVDLSLSLVPLLQETATSGIRSALQPGTAMDGGLPVFNNHEHPPMGIPISLATSLPVI
ncbi:Transcription factor MYC/MYB N-terminal [Dillenia turbinata]|uniref:Transcription factor MYC/MYB N-terminal n=1 Tax=Dillenia turbinata TaxID=194707 RepID=A0AAN8WAC2_9MAGN